MSEYTRENELQEQLAQAEADCEQFCEQIARLEAELAEARAVIEKLRAWVNKWKVNCPETICQSDSVQLGLYELGELVCESVGYFDYEATDAAGGAG